MNGLGQAKGKLSQGKRYMMLTLGWSVFLVGAFLGVLCGRCALDTEAEQVHLLLQSTQASILDPWSLLLSGGIFLVALWLVTNLLHWYLAGMFLTALKSFFFAYVFSLRFFLCSQTGFSTVVKSQVIYGAILWTLASFIIRKQLEQ